MLLTIFQFFIRRLHSYFPPLVLIVFGAVFKILKKVLISSSSNCFWAAVKINALLCTKSSEAKALQKSFLGAYLSDDIYLSDNIYLLLNSSTPKRVL